MEKMSLRGASPVSDEAISSPVEGRHPDSILSFPRKRESMPVQNKFPVKPGMTNRISRWTGAAVLAVTGLAGNARSALADMFDGPAAEIEGINNGHRNFGQYQTRDGKLQWAEDMDDVDPQLFQAPFSISPQGIISAGMPIESVSVSDPSYIVKKLTTSFG